MNNTALITGASSGIGLELAKIHAEKGGNLILVARNADKLSDLKTELEKKHGISVQLLFKDLSVQSSSQEVYDEVKKLGLHIDILINNAGFGTFGNYWETDWEKERDMINVHVMATAGLTKFFLKDMVACGSGKNYECVFYCCISTRSSHGDVLRYEGIYFTFFRSLIRRNQRYRRNRDCTLPGSYAYSLCRKRRLGRQQTYDKSARTHCKRSC